MRASSTRILIVGEEKNAAHFESILQINGFENINRCPGPTDALQMLEQDPAQIVIADIKMRDLDAFEFAASIREIERSEKRFTYILVISDESLGDNIDYYWQANVDAMILRNKVQTRLVPQVMSGERVSLLANSLLKNNTALQERCELLEPGQLLDSLTGLGNRRQAMSGIEDMIKEIEARGGAIALLLIRLDNLADLQAKHGEEIAEQMIVGVGQKIRRLTRPLDIVAYIDVGLFAIIMHHSDIEHCKPASYARFKTRLEQSGFRVRTGFIEPEISIGACGSSAETGPPKVDSLMAVAMSNLTNVLASEEIHISVLNRL